MKRRLAFLTALLSESLAALQGAPPDGAIFRGAEQAMTKPQIRAAIAKLKPRKLPTELLMPVVFSDHMVLQRDLPAPVWGRAVPGAEHYGANYPLRIANLAPFAVRGIVWDQGELRGERALCLSSMGTRRISPPRIGMRWQCSHTQRARNTRA